ncbi:MAG: LPS export ABC transporter periplasmic protein LptC [Gammaproteobacteria bacterium]
MNWRFAVAVLVLAFAAAGTWWLLRRVTPPTLQAAAAPTHAPDYTMTDATVTTLSRTGKTQAVMTSPRMLHHPDDDSVEVLAPDIHYFVTGSPPWHVTAAHALLPSGGQLVDLSGHVKMQHPNAQGGAPLVIETDKIQVNLNTSVATTADPVLITRGASRMSGVGLQAWLNDNHLVLQSQVRGEYVRQN